MADYTVTDNPRAIVFAPATVADEIVQNVRTILATRRGSVPLDRAFGISWDMLDEPMAVSRMRMMADITDAIRRYEPRATVRGVTFAQTDADAFDGIPRPVVTVGIDDAYLVPAPWDPKPETESEQRNEAKEAVLVSDVYTAEGEQVFVIMGGDDAAVFVV